ncbi:MAG: gamma-glutamylcyclotransferase family protein [Planctomycetota bacterium]
MVHHVFAYGSLMVPAVMRAVTGKLFSSEEAKLEGFARYLVAEQVHPGIVPALGHHVAGRLYLDIDQDSLKQLDYFESDIYLRQAVEVELPEGDMVEAFAYVVGERHRSLLSDQSWDEAEFIQRHLPGFLSRVSGWMQESD